MSEQRVGIGTVRVGSRVQVRYADGEPMLAVVGGDSADPMHAAQAYVSADSPLGRALLGRRAGDYVSFRAPGGLMGVVVESVS